MRLPTRSMCRNALLRGAGGLTGSCRPPCTVNWPRAALLGTRSSVVRRLLANCYILAAAFPRTPGSRAGEALCRADCHCCQRCRRPSTTAADGLAALPGVGTRPGAAARFGRRGHAARAAPWHWGASRGSGLAGPAAGRRRGHGGRRAPLACRRRRQVGARCFRDKVESKPRPCMNDVHEQSAQRAIDSAMLLPFGTAVRGRSHLFGRRQPRPACFQVRTWHTWCKILPGLSKLCPSCN